MVKLPHWSLSYLKSWLSIAGVSISMLYLIVRLACVCLHITSVFNTRFRYWEMVKWYTCCKFDTTCEWNTENTMVHTENPQWMDFLQTTDWTGAVAEWLERLSMALQAPGPSSCVCHLLNSKIGALLGSELKKVKLGREKEAWRPSTGLPLLV